MNQNLNRAGSSAVADVAASDLERELCRFDQVAKAGLVHWAIDPASEVSLIKHRENAVYALTTPAGEKYALRIHRSGYHSDAALRSELQWMSALNESGLHTPQSVKTASGDWFASVTDEAGNTTYQVDILTWVDGQGLGSVEDGLADDVEALAANYRQVGILAGRLHTLTEAWPKPDGFTRHAWDIDGCFSENAVWGRYQDLEALTAVQRATLDAARAKLEVLLQAVGKGQEVYGLIHCDFLPENLLNTGEDLFLIDFDDAGYGWYLFEFATSLFFFLGEPYFDDVYNALIEGYRTERALSEEHLQLLPAFFLLRAFVYLGWAHTRSETDTAKELTPNVVEAAMELAEAFINESNN